jgi:hypothetical protein
LHLAEAPEKGGRKSNYYFPPHRLIPFVCGRSRLTLSSRIFDTRVYLENIHYTSAHALSLTPLHLHGSFSKFSPFSTLDPAENVH